ncbi:DUF4349 domain-containing protein [Amycolatopsis benzoatilytica]|uniref:DUF4349 domain-containing protein n=1 Tax=Amycolatopsis benzoatilytica TaxID=346045 RepID=UPI00039EA9BC|nr:DUF4349 domain-containing protein [Amycolatopsis benzoatilytica]
MRIRWRYALACGLVLALAGCSGNSESSSGAQSAVAPVPGSAPRQSTDYGAGKSAVPAPVPAPGVTDRKLARSARLSLTAAKLDEVVPHARSIATAAGGYPGQESTSADSATLTLSVPAEKLDSVLDQLAGLGKVTRREVSADDVTAQVIDVDARLATQRASVDRMRALLAKAQTVSEIATVEGELTSREATLESLEQQQKSLAGQVAMATVTLAVSASAPPAESGGFLSGLAAGWSAFLDFCGGLVRVLGVVLPFVVVFGVPAGALAWWLRRRRKARLAE